MNYAVTYYNLPSNRCHKAGTLGKIVHSLNFWTLEQYRAFIQYVRNIRIHAAFQVLLYLGMRCGEMLALTLADFEFKANTIYVSKTLYRNRTGAPKTDNSNRAVTMPPAIMAEIKEYANKIYRIQPQDRGILDCKILHIKFLPKRFVFHRHKIIYTLLKLKFPSYSQSINHTESKKNFYL